jgi:uncharacterized membrane protein YheB (UPF0754 family)
MIQTSTTTLIALPVVAAFIGWLTNYVAVKMLFHPRKEIRIGFIRIQGVFPKRQKALARRLGEVVSSELFSADDVIQKLKEGSHSTEVLDFISPRVEALITEELPKQIPMLAMVLNPELVQTLKGAVMGLLGPLIDGLIEKLQQKMKNDRDVHAIVEEKVSNFSSDRLESMLLAIMKQEFRFIEILGGILGFFIGCIQVALLYL